VRKYFGVTGFPVYAWMKLPDMKLEKVKIIAEIIALFSIAFYFLYKNAAGWTEVTMSLDIVTNRVHNPDDKTKDILGVIVKVKNGNNNGSIRLSDAVAAIKYDNVTLENGLEGIVRYEIENGKVIRGKQSTQKPWTGLGPNEEILLSTYANVSTGAVCIVDVTVLAKRLLNRHCNESRSTAISLPIN
jgi:hypothetical protein